MSESNNSERDASLVAMSIGLLIGVGFTSAVATIFGITLVSLAIISGLTLIGIIGIFVGRRAL